MHSRHAVLVAVTVLGLAVAACGPSGPAVESPSDPDRTAPQASGGRHVCREPLGPDDPHPIGQADGQHPAFAGTDWWGAVAQAVDTGEVPGTAGVWLDQQAGELVVMVTADDPAAVLADLRDRVDDEHAERVVCMQATHAMDDLMALQQQVHEALSDAGVNASSGIDTVRNMVEVSHEGDPEEVEALLGELADHPALAVTRPDCADVVEPPDDAVPLPGDGSTCSGMDALLTGTLAGDAATGELWIEAEGERVEMAWPRGWYVMPDGTVHDHRGEARAVIGDDVGAGGGHVDGAFLVSSLDPVG